MRNGHNPHPGAVVISAGGSPAAYDIVRCLGLVGTPTSVASSQLRDIAFFLRHCAGAILLPTFEPRSHEEILRRLQEFSERADEKPVLYYVSDPELLFVWRYRDQLSPYYRFLMPPDELLEKLFNKVLFCELAQDY